MVEKPAIVWFRSDLRLRDNPAITNAVKSSKQLVFLYIYSNKTDAFSQEGLREKEWIFHSLVSLQKDLKDKGAKLIFRTGDESSALAELTAEIGADQIFANAEYDPFLVKRDRKIKMVLQTRRVNVNFFHGNLLINPFEMLHILEKPTKKLSQFTEVLDQYFRPEKPECAPSSFQLYPERVYSVGLKKPDSSFDFEKYWQAGERAALNKLEKGREILSPHLKTGEISPREIWHRGEGQEDLKIREFAYHLLIFFPESPYRPIQKEFLRFPWIHNLHYIAAWQKGKTGYPLIDAAMRELLITGYMSHENRLVVASFFVKNLLLPWQEGANWFMDHLVDTDLAINTYEWQEALGSIDNSAQLRDPIYQSKEIDPNGNYIRKFVPELSNFPLEYIHTPWSAPTHLLDGCSYPTRIVDLDDSNSRAIRAYNQTKDEK